MAKDLSVNVNANANFYGAPPYDPNDKNDLNNKISKAKLEAIYSDPNLQKFYVKSPNDFKKRGYEIGDFRPYKSQKFSNYDKPRLVFELVKHSGKSDEDENAAENTVNNETVADPENKERADAEEKNKEKKDYYYFKTGLYVGYLFIGTGKNRIRLDIDPGYSKTFFQRMLNVANYFYLDATLSGAKSKNSDSSLSNLISVMFLTRFKAAFAMGMPSEYKTIHERGFNIKGKIDIKKYIQKDMFTGGAVSYSYRQREYVQDIIDVLYLAMRTVMDSYKPMAAEYEKYYRQLKQMYSGKKVTKSTIRNIQNHRSLNNPLYSRYKTALYFAEMVLDMNEVIRDDKSSKNGYSGFLLDISQLWEVYLENLLRQRLGDEYTISAQEEIKLYKGTFYERTNRPDLVIKKDEEPVAVIDAKFKKMEYYNDDVDREDMFQINHYAGYYNEKSRLSNGKPLRFCALVYPSEFDPTDPEVLADKYVRKVRKDGKEEVNTDTSIYGLETSHFITKFSIEHIKIPKENSNENETLDTIVAAENAFIGRIKKLLENVPHEN